MVRSSNTGVGVGDTSGVSAFPGSNELSLFPSPNSFAEMESAYAGVSFTDVVSEDSICILTVLCIETLPLLPSPLSDAASESSSSVNAEKEDETPLPDNCRTYQQQMTWYHPGSYHHLQWYHCRFLSQSSDYLQQHLRLFPPQDHHFGDCSVCLPLYLKTGF